ncbi:MAG: hypothetical protein WA738_07340 [Candidatus Angelobacter sp.]
MVSAEHELDRSVEASAFRPPNAVPGRPGIQWGPFFRIASPLAALTGLLAAAVPLLGLFLMLPFSVRRVIFRYRSHHTGQLGRTQGARLGAFAAMLSYFSFLIFFLATISLKRADVIQIVQERMQKNPEPQTQEMIRLLSTNEGFFAFMTLVSLFFLILFLLLGMASGALAVGSSGPHKRP